MLLLRVIVSFFFWSLCNGVPVSSFSNELGYYQPELINISILNPQISTAKVSELSLDNLWNNFWDSDSESWVNVCGTQNNPVLWQVAIASNAIADTDSYTETHDVMNYIMKYYNSNIGGYSASNPPDSDIYIDDDSYISWVIAQSYKVTGDSDFLSSLESLMDFIKSQKNFAIGGINWKYNATYVASISTVEAGLAAMKLYEQNQDGSMIDFAKYCMNSTFSLFLDPSTHFIWDGIQNGQVNKGILSYTIGVAISTLVRLSKVDFSADWLSIAVEFAVRAMGSGRLDSPFYTDGYLHDPLMYSHLLLIGFVDLITIGNPASTYQEQVFELVRNETIRESRNYYDLYSLSVFNSACPESKINTLLLYSSLVRIFQAVEKITDSL